MSSMEGTLSSHSHQYPLFIIRNFADSLLHATNLNSTINVCFERSGKLAATKDVSLSAEGELLCASFDQTLSLVVTLYKNADGSYQEKTGKLIVRQPKLSMMGGASITDTFHLHCKHLQLALTIA